MSANLPRLAYGNERTPHTVEKGALDGDLGLFSAGIFECGSRA